MSWWVFIRASLWHSWGMWRRNLAHQTRARVDYEAAVRAMNRALALAPGMRAARLDRGILLWRELDRPEAALTDFDHLLREDPGDVLALLNRAQAFQALGQYEAALADLAAFLDSPERDPEYVDIAARTAMSLQQIIWEQRDGGSAGADSSTDDPAAA